MILELLPNELLHEVYEYLDTVELIRIFHNLNSRFNSLLYTYFNAYRVNFYSVLKYQSDFHIHDYFPLIINKIISLRLSNNHNESSLQTDFFFSSRLFLNQFMHLRSLSLCYINCNKTLRKLLMNCHQLPYLSHFKMIKCHATFVNSVLFSNIIWNMPKLTHCRLDLQDFFRVPTLVSLSIEYVSISCENCWLNQIARLFQQTPYLQRFHISLNHLNENLKILPSFLSLTMLKLSDVRSLNVMINILQAVPNLTHLKVDMHINCDGYQWEKIINNYLPKLKIFRFRMYSQFNDEKNNEEYVDQLIDSFRTEFWIKKYQWFIRCHSMSYETYQSILLYSLPYAFSDFILNRLTMKYKSTCFQDDNNDYFLYDKVNNLQYEYILASNYFSFIQFSNIRNLSIDLRFEKNIWKNAPVFYQLMTITVLNTDENAQFYLQSLLDQSPRLYSLIIQSWPSSQLPIVKNTNTSLRRIDLRHYQGLNDNSLLNIEECYTFIKSILVIQSEELLISVKNRESIIDLVNKMSNLRMLNIEYLFSQTSISVSSRYERKTDLFIKWLQSQFSTASIISKIGLYYNSLKLWIYLKNHNVTAIYIY